MTKVRAKILKGPENRYEQIVRHITKFSLASLIGGVGSFFNNYCGALLLGPTVWGIWQGAKLVLVYGGNLNMGVPNGMNREIPILRGRQDKEQESVITNVTFSFTLVIALITSVGIILPSFVFELGQKLTLILRFIAPMIFLLHIRGFYALLLRGRGEFNLVSIMTLMDGFGNVFSILLIFPYGLSGFLAGQLIRISITTGYACWKSTYVVCWHWNWKALYPLVVIGFPIMLITLTNAMFATTDRLLILAILGARSLGFYSLGNLVFAPFLIIFSAASTVMYTNYGYKYGKTNDPKSLKKDVIFPMQNLSILISLIIGITCIALPWIVHKFLPAYTDGITPSRILMFGLFFFAITSMPANLLLTLDKQVHRLVIVLVSLLTNLTFSYLALRLGYGITGVAVGTTLGYLLFFFCISGVAMFYTAASIKEMGLMFLKILSPIFYVGLIVIIVDAFPLTNVKMLSFCVESLLFQILFFILLCSYYIYKALYIMYYYFTVKH
jgi:O-antigen/teichoic acid export membrane protein